jgi:surface polysaccharide O-acyltransferase-like enzyme
MTESLSPPAAKSTDVAAADVVARGSPDVKIIPAKVSPGRPASDSEATSAALRASAESRRIQTLRGLACFLLVGFHVVGAHPTSGLHVDNDSVYRFFANLFLHVRMPLFTFLSGFVYAYRPVRDGQLRRFASRKIVRLLVPFFVVTTLFYVTALVVPVEVTGKLPLSDAWRVYLYPYVHFWFLQAIVLIFGVVAVLDRWKLMATPTRFAIVMSVACVIHVLLYVEHDLESFFAYLKALYLAPFFLLGIGLNRFRTLLLRPSVIGASIVVFLIAMAIHGQEVWNDGAYQVREGTWLGLTIGVTAAIALVGVFPRLSLLERVGAYSFAIYLFHPFFVAGSRTVLKFAGLNMTAVAFAVCLIVGIVGPVILQRMIGDRPVAGRLLFGSPQSPGGSQARGTVS